MKTNPTLFLVCTMLALLAAAPQPTSALAADNAAFAEIGKRVKSEGKLILEDDFDRDEEDDSKEQPGNDWSTNSRWRAAGAKQADLQDGVLVITMAQHADHAVVVKHDAPFDDGVVQVRFRMQDGKGIGFNFNDPKCKVSHAGHICHVGVKPGVSTFVTARPASST